MDTITKDEFEEQDLAVSSCGNKELVMNVKMVHSEALQHIEKLLEYFQKWDDTVM